MAFLLQRFWTGSIYSENGQDRDVTPKSDQHKPKRSRMGDDCCEPLPQSVGAKKGLGLGLRLSLTKPMRSQSKSDDCSEPLSQSQGTKELVQALREKKQPLVISKLVLL